MKTVLHTEASPGLGGQEVRTLNEARWTVERGWRVLLACQPDGRLLERAPHADRRGLDRGLPGPPEQAPIRLAGQQDAPAALRGPARLVEGAHLLAAEPRRGFRVEDGFHATASLTSRSTVSGSIRVRQM